MSHPDPGGLRAGDVLTRRYLLLERIAWGGMSVIWRAFDQSLQRMVAVKLLDGELGADRGERELIRREARATARLVHPDAIEVYDYGETVTSHGRLAAYVVMRLLEGHPLADRIAEGPLPWAEAALIAARLATVLAAAHERGIVHRDVTAGNVLLTPTGAKLLDFGIAAFVGEDDDDRTSGYGTPPYVAPERLTGAAADPASDVYALGVLLFEMLTGAPPYPERTWEEIENTRREGPPPVPDVPGMPTRIGVLCRDCLAHRPEARPKAREVADELTEALARPPRRIGLVRWTPASAVAAAVASAMAAVVVWSQLSDPRSGQAAGLRHSEAPTTVLDSATSRPEATRSGPALTPGAARSESATSVPSSPGPALRDEPGVGSHPTTDEVRTVAPSLGQSVRRFNALLAEGQDEGTIRPDVALDLRQVLANTVCCSRDLTSVHGKIADRHREGALSDELRDALEAQLRLVSVALSG
ncbi:serine/threonine protein kinase [Streptosporangium becharense]|uniref:non-specific serine/threonine protein kinase n=1 Tax=Streptosporangium becharense TaxID=1816182 RepID=A0A7W9IFE4_9ACTN|nr:serine/threonine-protein kinase [Streptosporangium becharense]MBB2909261.1 serine/threonine protein kinase [Streptosporangium becharense]MBB5819720.1 serine/threonine protein kinase [Streptosporangium becharense]